MSELVLPVEPGASGAARVVSRLREVLAGRDSVGIIAGDAPSAPLLQAIGTDAPASPSIILTTSGSTGAPRGVELPIEAVCASARLAEQRIGGPGLWLTAIPVTSAGGLNTIARSLLNGAEPVVWPGIGGAMRFDGASFVPSLEQVLRNAKATGLRAYTSLVPTQLSRLASYAAANDSDSVQALTLLARLDAVLVGADALSEQTRNLARAYGIHCVTTYGATETSGGCIYDNVPLDGVGIEFIGEEPGRIVLTGPTIARRYRTGDSNDLGNGRWLSPDLGRMRMGHLELVGRVDDLVKVGGSSIALPLISQQLRTLASLDDVITLHRSDEEWGAVPIAFVVGGDANDNLLRKFAAAAVGRTSLPMDIVRLPALPLLANGKVDRQTLLKMVK